MRDMPLSATWPIHLTFAICCAFIFGCASNPEPVKSQAAALPPSQWDGNYRYAYNKVLPQEGAASVPVTICVVNPAYKAEDLNESALAATFYKPVGKGFSASMGVDMDKILISKGMTTKGPYTGINEITYSDKKASDLALTPSVFINADPKPIGGHPMADGSTSQPGQAIYMGEYEPGKHWGMREFELKISGWFVWVLQEPLSGEKMWIKRLELDEFTTRAVVCYEASEAGYNLKGVWYHTGWTVSETIIRDLRMDSMANALKQYYPIILDKLQTYIDVNELLEIKKKVEEIRILKRY